jgi:hypothetical protein
MAIRVIEVPSSVRFDPPPRPCLEHRREPTISMSDDQRRDDPPRRRGVGALGMSEEELAEFFRTGNRSDRASAAPEANPAPRPLGEALLDLILLSQRSNPGARGKIAKDIALVRELLKATGNNVEQARTRFIVEQAGAGLIDEPPRGRLIVRQGNADLKVRRSGKRVIDLTPEERSVFSKRFTRAVKEIRDFTSAQNLLKEERDNVEQTLKNLIDRVNSASERLMRAIDEISK